MKKKAEKRPAVREGREDKGLAADKTASNKDAYPRKSKKDVQFNNQPEFTEPDSNKKRTNSKK